MLSVGLLGVFRVAGADNRTWSELGPAGRGLASFLFAYPGRPHRRERLADLFWPELDAERARRALNSAIWRLRKLLASEPRSAGGRNLLTIGTETILERAPWLDIDATALQEAAAMALRQPETLLDRAKLNHVAQVLHRYEGPFLEGDDGDWILEERERLHSLFLRTATMAVCRLGAVGVYHDAISLARRALRFDPYREELVRTLLTLLALDERRGEAIQYYQQWSTSLKSELDIAPLPATRKVLEEIRGLESLEGFQTLHTLLVDARL
ncbi:MAG: BTAD domain-containing putative transcriptional regulator [Xanthobacteraceae bacterium]|jgi:DNA-binding SARP family transcriptional activator